MDIPLKRETRWYRRVKQEDEPFDRTVSYPSKPPFYLVQNPNIMVRRFSLQIS